MICLNCGKTIDDDLKVCPFCGSLTEAYEEVPAYYETPADEEPAVDIPDAAPDAEDDSKDFFDPDPVYPAAKPAAEGRAPRFSAASLAAVALAALSCLLSLICLITLLSLRSGIKEQEASLTGSVNALNAAVAGIDSRLGQLDTTLSGVQSEAYNQYASQAIAITKDITPLTGPVDAGKYNRMFIITAKGNLNVNDSFDWQRYNEATGGWVSLVFTGDATDNAQYGLRLENTFDRNENAYTSILWANGITKEADGTYRCVITDATGVTKTSAEATVTVN